jgi:hypothetical protein
MPNSSYTNDDCEEKIYQRVLIITPPHARQFLDPSIRFECENVSRAYTMRGQVDLLLHDMHLQFKVSFQPLHTTPQCWEHKISSSRIKWSVEQLTTLFFQSVKTSCQYLLERGKHIFLEVWQGQLIPPFYSSNRRRTPSMTLFVRTTPSSNSEAKMPTTEFHLGIFTHIEYRNLESGGYTLWLCVCWSLD